MKKFLLFFMLLLAPIFTQAAFAQNAHKVTLHWGASPSTSVTHYAVYRATVSGGPYTYLGFTTGLAYVNSKNPDGTTLPEGTTFYYVVVAFTATDPVTHKADHSVDSNEAVATIPTTVVILPATGLTTDAQ